VSHVTHANKLLHGNEDVVFGASGYTGVAKREELNDLDAAFLIAEKLLVIKAMKRKREQRQVRTLERLRASARKGRASVHCDQVAVRLHEGALSRHCDERCLGADAIRAVEPLDVAPAGDAGGGISASARRRKPVWRRGKTWNSDPFNATSGFKPRNQEGLADCSNHP
jgi:IS5 family transposase